jgi:hypothetical protein
MGEASKPGLSDEKAARMMVALRAGQTLRKFGVKAPRLEAYFKIHPDYAREARPLLDANKKLAFKRKADRFRAMTHCVHGHPLSEARIRHYKGWTVRDCLRCEEIRRARGGIMRPETLAKVKFAFERGGTVSEIIHGRPIGGGPVDRSLRLVDSAAFYRYRRENLEFDRFIAETIAKNNSRGQQIRYARERTRAQTAARRHEANDYGKIRALFPANFPGRDDVVSDIFEALLSGSLKREDVKARVKEYMAAHNRMFPTDFAKFGDGRLVSLDVRLFEDGAMTLGDTISRGLWD